jgi:hypothetical protein
MPLVQLSLTYVGLGADHGAVGAFHSVDEAVAQPAGRAVVASPLTVPATASLARPVATAA